MASHPPDEVLEALWTVNQLAKDYAERASDSYDQGFKGMASDASARKGALYDLKSAILTTWYADEEVAIDEVFRHKIDGREYYCLEIGGYSFHTPVSDWGEIEPATDVKTPPAPSAPTVEDPEHLEDFEATSSYEHHSDMGERQALSVLADHTGYSPNDFLHQEWDTNGHRPRYIGWDRLPRSKALGDEVPEDEVTEFLFVVGDTLQTYEHGEVEIDDRYGVIDTGIHRDSPRPVPHYDVTIESDEQKQGVSQKDLQEWDIRVGDPEDPLLPDRLLHQTVHEEIPFKPGDELRLEWEGEVQSLVVEELLFTEGGLIMVVFESTDRDGILGAVDDIEARLVDSKSDEAEPPE